MSQSSKCDASCRGFFLQLPRSHGGCLFQSSCSEFCHKFIFGKAYHASIVLITCLSFFYLLFWWFFYIFSNMQISLYTDNKLIQSHYRILLIHCWSYFLLKIFVSLCMKNTGLYFVVISSSGFDVGLMLISQKD